MSKIFNQTDDYIDFIVQEVRLPGLTILLIERQYFDDWRWRYLLFKTNDNVIVPEQIPAIIDALKSILKTHKLFG